MLTDPMGDYIDFVQFNGTTQQNGLTHVPSEDTIYWNLKQATPVCNEEAKTYTYNLSYRIKLDTLKSGYNADTEYAANKTTSLTYFIKNDGNEQIKAGTAYFNVPSVKGYEGSISFTKTNENNLPLEGAKFNVVSKETNKVIATGTSSSDGTVTIANIPSGHEYQLVEEETTATKNYKMAAPIDFSVSWGNTDFTNGQTIKNEVKTKDITVTKVWDDNNNQDGLRKQVQVELYKKVGDAESETTGIIKTLGTENNATATFTVPIVENNTPVTYTVKEVAETIPTGYTSTVTGNDNSGFIVTNKHTPEVISVIGSKTWNDDNNAAEARPGSITINLLADGVKIDSKTVADTDNWAWSFVNLPKYKDGKEINYTITESAVNNYSSSVKGYNVTNTYAPGKTFVTVTKSWNDGDDADGMRPESVVVALCINNVPVEGATLTLDESNKWTGTFNNLDITDSEGKAISYSVKELNVPSEYIDSVTGDANKGFVIKNTHTPAKADISVTKVWNDGNNKDKIRPESVTVNLYAGDSDTGRTLVLSAANNWSGAFDNV